VFYVEICTGSTRLTLDTFATMEQAARAYDMAAWRLGRHRQQLNFIEAPEAGLMIIDETDECWADLVLTEPSESSGSDFDFSNFQMYCIHLIIVLVVVLKPIYGSMFDLIFNHMYAKLVFDAVKHCFRASGKARDAPA
jgi:hypothetical protein